MKATVMKENLTRALALVNGAVASRTTLPVLQNVLLEARGGENENAGELVVKATNLEISAGVVIPARVEEPGAGTVPARVFTDFVAALTGETVALEWVMKTATLNVQCGAFKSRIKGIDAAEFPAWPADDPGDAVIVFDAATALNAALSQVTVAVATENSRPVLTGVCAVIGSDAVTFAGADGFRLAVQRVPATVPSSPPATPRPIIPVGALKLAQRFTETPSVEWRVSATARRVTFRASGAEVWAALIDGEYPQFERLIPDQSTGQVTVARADLAHALKANQTFAADNKGRMELQIGADGAVTVCALSPTSGDGAAELSGTLEGAPGGVLLSHAYLRDCVQTLSAPQITLAFSGAARPVVVRAPGDPGFVCVMMPMVAHAATPAVSAAAPAPQSA